MLLLRNQTGINSKWISYRTRTNFSSFTNIRTDAVIVRFSVFCLFSARRALGFLARKLLFISFHFTRSPVDGDEEMGKTNTDEISRAHPKECRRGLIICECVYNNNAPFFTFFILLRFGIIPHFVVAAAMRFFWTPDAIFMCVLIYSASLETIKLFTSFICCEWENWECCAWEISLLVGGRWMPVASSWVCCKNYAFQSNLE